MRKNAEPGREARGFVRADRNDEAKTADQVAALSAFLLVSPPPSGKHEHAKSERARYRGRGAEVPRRQVSQIRERHLDCTRPGEGFSRPGQASSLRSCAGADSERKNVLPLSLSFRGIRTLSRCFRARKYSGQRRNDRSGSGRCLFLPAGRSASVKQRL